jgi:hypothetical protein
MELLKQGTRVVIIGTEIKALITGVSARGEDYIQYDIVWWANGERKTEWVFSFEIEPYNDNSKPAGFKNYDNKQTLIE